MNASDRIKIILLTILICVIQLGVIWLLFWLIDKVLLIESLDIFDVSGKLLNEFGNASGYFGKFIANVIDSLWLYAAAVSFVMLTGAKENAKAPQIIGNAILGTLLIIIYDPRIAMALPSFLAAPLVFLQTKCHFSFVEHPNIADLYYSSGGIDPFYYTSFDILVAIIFLFSVAITCRKRE